MGYRVSWARVADVGTVVVLVDELLLRGDLGDGVVSVYVVDVSSRAPHN